MKKEEFETYYVHAKSEPIPPERIEPLRHLKPQGPPEPTDGEKHISRGEAAEDIGLFFELLRYNYAGYAYYRDKVDFSAVERELLDGLPADGTTARALLHAIHSALFPFLNDSHFTLKAGEEYASFQKLFNAFFTGLVLAPDGEDYTVVNGTDAVPAGRKFSGQEVSPYLFETLPTPDGEKRYLLGVYTDNPVESLSVGGTELPLHLCRTDSWRAECDYFARMENGIPIVHHGNYRNENLQWNYERFRRMGELFRDAPELIFSLLSNSGGNSNYPMHFIEGLNGYACWEIACAVVQSPLLTDGKSEPVKTYRIENSEASDPSKGTYDGTLYVLMNKYVASSGEAALKYASSVRNVKFIGSASMGCGQFGEILRYRLPHSGVYVWMGYKVFNMNGFEEGKGILPDYWLDEDNPISALKTYLLAKNAAQNPNV